MSFSIHPWIDDSLAPIYVISYPAESPDEDFQSYVAAWEAFTVGQTRAYGVICDGSQVVKMPPSQRKMAAEMDKRLAPMDRRLCAGTAFIVTNAIGRGMLTAFLWLAPPVYPHKVVSSRDDALAWLRTQLATFASAAE